MGEGLADPDLEPARDPAREPARDPVRGVACSAPLLRLASGGR